MLTLSPHAQAPGGPVSAYDAERDEERKRKRIRKRLMKSLRRQLKLPAATNPAAQLAASAGAPPLASAAAGKRRLSASEAAGVLAPLAGRHDSINALRGGAGGPGDVSAAGPATTGKGGEAAAADPDADRRRGSIMELIAAGLPSGGEAVSFPLTLDAWERRQAEACVDLAEDIDEELRSRLSAEVGRGERNEKGLRSCVSL